MKLVFKKNEGHIQVYQKVNDGEKAFEYVEMIKTLITSKELEDPEISNGFSDAEVNSINSMITHINKKIISEAETTGDALPEPLTDLEE